MTVALRMPLAVAGALALGLAMSSAAFATDPVAKWCSGVKIAAFPGGPQGGVFANNVYNGYRQAELDLGPTVTYYFSNWDPNTMLTQLQQAIATKVDGIAFMGHPGDDAAGFALGAEAAKRAGLKSGDKALVWGLKAAGGDRGQRTVGVIDALTKAGVNVIYQEIDSATNADPNAGTATFVGMIKANPDIKLVVTDHGGLTSNVGVYAKAASLSAGQVYFAGFDMSPNTAQAVKNGYQNLVIDQQPYLQGYLPILNICLTKKFGFSGLDINTAGAFVDKSNVDTVAPLAAQEIR